MSGLRDVRVMVEDDDNLFLKAMMGSTSCTTKE